MKLKPKYIIPRLKDLWKLLKEIFVLIGSAPIFLSLAIIGVFYTLVKHLINMDYSLSRQLVPIVRSATLITDAFANAGAGELLNDINKVNHHRIKYGKWYQTISAVTGLLQLYWKDLRFRKFLDAILGKKHCENAITPNDRIYYFEASDWNTSSPYHKDKKVN